MGIIWMIVIGFVVGVIVKFFMLGDNELVGFVLMMIFGIVGVFVVSFFGQVFGWYVFGEGVGFIGVVVGVFVFFFVWGIIVKWCGQGVYRVGGGVKQLV